MATELESPPSAEYIPQNNGNQALQAISPKKQIAKEAKNIFHSVLMRLNKLKEATSPKVSRKKLPFSDYLRQSKVFVLKSSKERSDEGKSFETVTDSDKPYIHCMMGGGIIAIPYALKQVGIPIGVILIMVFAFLVDYCTLLMMQNSLLAQQDTYQDTVKEVFGAMVYMLVCSLQIFFYLSVLTLYNGILADIFPKLFNRILVLCSIEHIKITRRFSMIVVIMLILIPLCLCRSIRRISKISLVSFLCVTALIAFSLIRLTTIGQYVPYTHSPFRFSNMNVFQAIGVVVFIYLNNHSAYFFNASIQDSAQSRFSSTTYANMSYSLLSTLLLGVTGFITFKGLVQGDFLENYCEEDDMANIARLLVAIFIIVLYPLECHGGREIIYKTLFPQRTITVIVHIGTTVAMIGCACIISLFVDCVSLILEVSGLLLALPLVVLVPCGCFLRLSKGSMQSIRKLPCLLLASASCMIMIVGIVMVIFVMPHGCIHTTRYLPYCNGSSELLGPLITLMSLNETMELDPLLGFNVTEYGYDNITDIAAAYFT